MRQVNTVSMSTTIDVFDGSGGYSAQGVAGINEGIQPPLELITSSRNYVCSIVSQVIFGFESWFLQFKEEMLTKIYIFVVVVVVVVVISRWNHFCLRAVYSKVNLDKKENILRATWLMIQSWE